MASGEVPPITCDHALFLDLDGTLVELRNDPAVTATETRLRQLLESCALYLEGAVAIVSGRPIHELDRSLGDRWLPVSGLHGLERRDARGCLSSSAPPAALLKPARERLVAELGSTPGVIIEDKGATIAIHFRRARASKEAIMSIAESLLARLGSGYRLLSGADVLEIVPLAAGKGHAVRAFMAEDPFRGRIPLFVGDDVTDLDGFSAVRSFGGHGIAVGGSVSAEYHLPGVEAVLAWIRACTQRK